LAAAHVGALSVEALAERLNDRFPALVAGSRTALPRHQTLQALIDWTYDLLSEAGRTLLRRLSVFAGGWTLEVAEAVCAGDGIEASEVLGLLTRLVEKSLAVYEAREEEDRYGLLETIRQYARQRLLASGETAVVRGQHLDWVVALASQAGTELFAREQAAWLARLEREHDNLRAALDWALESRQVHAGLRIGGSVWRFWLNRGYGEEGRERLEALLSHPEASERTRVRAKALHGLGSLTLRGDLAAARSYYEELLAIGRELGDKQVMAIALNGLGDVGKWQDNREEAQALFEQGLVLAREVGDRWEVAFSLAFLGVLAERKGENSAAWSLYEESLAIRRELGDKRGIIRTLYVMAEQAADQGNWRIARALVEERLALSRELGDRGEIADALSQLARATQAEGDLRTAWALSEEALALGRELGDRHVLMALCCSQGHLLLERGDAAAARSRHEECLALRRTKGNRVEVAWSLLEAGHAAWLQGEYGATQSHAVEALGLFQEQENGDGILAALESLAAVAMGQGRKEHAARLAGAAEALREAWGLLPGVSWWRRPRERIGAAMRTASRDEAFTTW
jgi:tetratricopeptide (TPR) repeat protein